MADRNAYACTGQHKHENVDTCPSLEPNVWTTEYRTRTKQGLIASKMIQDKTEAKH
jgi:hypothetical protein